MRTCLVEIWRNLESLFLFSYIVFLVILIGEVVDYHRHQVESQACMTLMPDELFSGNFEKS